MAPDDVPQDPQEAVRARRLLEKYAQSTRCDHEGEALYTIACDLIAELLALAACDELPEIYGQSSTHRVAALAARSVWNALELNARRVANATGADQPDGPTREDIHAAIAANLRYLLTS